jgi:tRNA pseudouridine55 synthase
VDLALEAFRGAFDQVPPQHSAKKVGGRRAYDLARRDRPVELAPVRVVVHELQRLDGPREGIVRLRVRAGSGFYVRALARDLGERLGCGAHLAALRRVASGTFDVADAIPLEDAERLGPELASRVIPPAEALADVRAVTVTAAGAVRVRHGNLVGPEYLSGAGAAAAAVEAPGGLLRVLGPDGALLALARPEGGALHPTLVLG